MKNDKELFEEYLSNFSANTARSKKIVYEKILGYTENIRHKRICDLSCDEIIEMMKFVSTGSYNTLYNMWSFGSVFTDWCIAKGESLSGINYFREVPPGEIEKALFKEKKVVCDWEYLKKNINAVESPITRFAILSSFDGLTTDDIINLKRDDIIEEENSFLLKRGKLSVHPETISSAKDMLAYGEELFQKNGNSILAGATIMDIDTKYALFIRTKEKKNFKKNMITFLVRYVKKLNFSRGYVSEEAKEKLPFAEMTLKQFYFYGMIDEIDKRRGDMSPAEYLDSIRYDSPLFYRYKTLKFRALRYYETYKSKT